MESSKFFFVMAQKKGIFVAPVNLWDKKKHRCKTYIAHRIPMRRVRIFTYIYHTP